MHRQTSSNLYLSWFVKPMLSRCAGLINRHFDMTSGWKAFVEMQVEAARKHLRNRRREKVFKIPLSPLVATAWHSTALLTKLCLKARFQMVKLDLPQHRSREIMRM